MAKTKINTSIKIDAYAVISRAVEEGIEYGYNRAHKHTDTPSKDHIISEIDSAVMNAICEVVKFDEPEVDDGETK